MYRYHVFFTTNSGVADSEVEAVLSHFVRSEMKENLMIGYGITKFENKASFPNLSDYHFTAHYDSKEDQEKAMEAMAKRFTKEPHASLMRITKEFRVAFSRELKIDEAEPSSAGNVD